VLAEYLRHYVKEDQTNWDQWIVLVTYTYNKNEHSATGFTPFKLLFRHPSILPSALTGSPEPQYNYDDYVSKLRSRLQMVHKQAHKILITSRNKRNIMTKWRGHRNCR
jgi:hypothetical protein